VRPVATCGGALLLVGGHSRGVGKTLTVERILRARRGEMWVAVKVSAHRHGRIGAALSIDEDTTASPATQTGRYLLAGATRAFLLRTPDAQLEAAARVIGRLRADGFHLVVESNRLVNWLAPDGVLFAVAPAIDDWKPSSDDMLARADAFVVLGASGSDRVADVHAPDQRARPVFCHGDRRDDRRLADWLDLALGRLAPAKPPGPGSASVTHAAGV
jgi:hypothetical protein